MRETGSQLVPDRRAAVACRGARAGTVWRRRSRSTAALAALARDGHTPLGVLTGTALRSG